MSHNFCSRYTRKSIKGSLDADFDLVFNQTWVQKMAHWDGAQGQAKMAKITQKHPYLWWSPQKSSNPKQKNFFFNFDYKTCWIRRQAWQVVGLQSSARKVAHAGLKGLKKEPKWMWYQEFLISMLLYQKWNSCVFKKLEVKTMEINSYITPYYFSHFYLQCCNDSS